MNVCKECHHRPSMRVADHGAECQCRCHDVADMSPRLVLACENAAALIAVIAPYVPGELAGAQHELGVKWRSSQQWMENVLADLRGIMTLARSSPGHELKKMPPIVVSMALSLYAFNVRVAERARKLLDHFKGECMDLDELEDILQTRGAYAATELPYPTALVYVQHAMERYGDEARKRAEVEAKGI